VPAYNRANGARAQILLPPPQIVTSLFYTPKQINIYRSIQHSVGLQWEHVSDCRSTVRWSVVSTSLDINLPSRRHRHFHCDACNLDVGFWQVSNFAWLQCVIEINARATEVALRPTAVSEGRPANWRVVTVVQWQWAQHRQRQLTGLFDHG